ncbi:MAG TPA: NUDIX hydrolase [Gemmatimonadaceae bacterium]|nr:NUDIX hydrolase [Gemmatimonadaceae bacterium]
MSGYRAPDDGADGVVESTADNTAGNTGVDAAPEGVGKVRSTRKYTGRIINVDVDDVRFPDGSVGQLEMVRHPGASAVLPFLTDPFGDDPQVLLIRQYRYAAEGYLYEVPAGRIDPGETPEQCAVRELREETGCTAGFIKHLYTFYTTPGFTDEKIHAFMASDLERGVNSLEADEFVETISLPLSRALAMIREGKIVDAKTALTLLYAAGFELGI